MKVAFLDRDGVINKEVNYLYRKDDFEFTVNCIQGLKRLNANGYEIIVVTNQAGIARGYYTVDDYNKLTVWYTNILFSHGIKILDVFFCPHHPQGNVKEFAIACSCRKPQPGMLDQAFKKYDINISDSIMVGDKISDMLAAITYGINNAYLVETGHTIPSDQYDNYNVYPDLLQVPL